MNRKLGLMAALPALALVTIAAMQQDGILLRRELKEGAQDTYRIDIKGNMTASVPAMGDQQMAINGGMNYAVKLGKVDSEKGSAEAEFITSDMEFKLEGPMADMAAGNMPQMPKEAKTTGTIDNRGRTIQKMAGMSPEMMMMMGPGLSSIGQGIDFPEKAVKIGDSWEVVIPKNPMINDQDSKLTAKLIGETTVDGIAAYEITLEGTLPVKPNLKELMKNNPNADATGMLGDMEIKGTLDMKSRGMFDRVTGKIITMETLMDTKESISVMSMEVPITGTMKITMKQKK